VGRTGTGSASGAHLNTEAYLALVVVVQLWFLLLQV
jgi:hypothetical protein